MKHLNFLLVVLAIVLGQGKIQADELGGVYALKYGEFHSFPNYAMYWMGDPRFGADQELNSVYMYFWLIQTDEHNILVDTGTTDALAERYALSFADRFVGANGDTSGRYRYRDY